MPVPEITVRPVASERLVNLHPVSQDNLAELWEIDRAVLNHMTDADRDRLATPQLAYELGERDDALLFGISVPESGLIGFSLLSEAHTGYPRIGTCIARERYLQTGIGSLSVMGLTEYVLKQRHGYGLYAETLMVNKPAQAWLRRVGAVCVRTGSENFVPYGLDGRRSRLTAWMLFAHENTAIHTRIKPAIPLDDIITSLDRYERLRSEVIVDIA